jgi:chemotaxis protein MotB
VLSETLNAVFMEAPKSQDPVQVGEPVREVITSPEAPPAPRPFEVTGDGEADAPSETPGEQDGLSAGADGKGGEGDGGEYLHDGTITRITDELALSMQQYIDDDLMTVNQVGTRIEIEMKEQMLFPSGTARLTRQAMAPLRGLSTTLKRISSHLQVEGHTDNLPISTAAFPSNWELSAARAASVVHFFSRQGVEPWRMAAVGHGEHRPLADNDTAKGRSANRRVTVVILAGKRGPIGPMADDEEVPWAEGPAAGEG